MALFVYESALLVVIARTFTGGLLRHIDPNDPNRIVEGGSLLLSSKSNAVHPIQFRLFASHPLTSCQCYIRY